MKERGFFCEKMFENTQIPQMNQPKMFRINSPSDELFLHFFFESSESDRVFNYLHESNSIFRARRINSEIIFGRTVCPWSGCQCSYSNGQGPAIGPHTGRGCIRYLTNVWRALAPLLSPWCADGDVPPAANLNLYEGSRSHVSWHCDDEPLFGGIGDSKLIVSLSLLRHLQMEGEVML